MKLAVYDLDRGAWKTRWTWLPTFAGISHLAVKHTDELLAKAELPPPTEETEYALVERANKIVMDGLDEFMHDAQLNKLLRLMAMLDEPI